MLFHNLLITCVHIVLIALVIENEVKTETNNVLVVYRHFTRFIVRTNKARDFLQNCLERQRGLCSKVLHVSLSCTVMPWSYMYAIYVRL